MKPTKLSDLPATKTEPAKPLKLTPEIIKMLRAAMAYNASGLKGRRLRNAARRARGQEPEPGLRAGVKRHARYLSRVPATADMLKVTPHVHPRHLRVAA